MNGRMKIELTISLMVGIVRSRDMRRDFILGEINFSSSLSAFRLKIVFVNKKVTKMGDCGEEDRIL